jgi:hypothetical protein
VARTVYDCAATPCSQTARHALGTSDSRLHSDLLDVPTSSITLVARLARGSPNTTLMSPITPFWGAASHFYELPTTRPSDFPEADLWPASIRCCEPANLRPKPNGPLIRDYVRDGDLSPTMYNPELVDELKAMKEASWLSYMFDS